MRESVAQAQAHVRLAESVPGWKLKQVDAISANGLIGVAGADPDPAGGG